MQFEIFGRRHVDERLLYARVSFHIISEHNTSFLEDPGVAEALGSGLRIMGLGIGDLGLGAVATWMDACQGLRCGVTHTTTSDHEGISERLFSRTFDVATCAKAF